MLEGLPEDMLEDDVRQPSPSQAHESESESGTLLV